MLLPRVAWSCRHALSASGRQRFDAWFVAGVAAVNVVLNLVLIPPLGVVGAALATLVAEGLILAWGWREVTRALGPLALGPSALVAAGGVAAMTLALLPLRAAPLPLSLATGALVYAAAILALDRQLPGQLRALLGSRQSSVVGRQ